MKRFLAMAAAGAVLALAGCSLGDDFTRNINASRTTSASPTTTSADNAGPAEYGGVVGEGMVGEESASASPQAAACTYTPSGKAAREAHAPNTDALPQGTVTMTLNTNAGVIPMELYADRTPCAVGAIAGLAEQGYYDDTICHRVTTDGIFVLQCGDPSGTGRGGPGFQFNDEYPVNDAASPATRYPGVYKAGTLAMANSGPDTNGSQFFLTYEDSPLPPSYTVFGALTPDGLNVVRTIAAKGAADGLADGAPAEEVRITKATVSAAQ